MHIVNGEGSGDERAIQLKWMQDAMKEGHPRSDIIMMYTIAIVTGQGLGIVKTVYLEGKEKFQEAFRMIGRPESVKRVEQEQHYKPLESDT